MMSKTKNRYSVVVVLVAVTFAFMYQVSTNPDFRSPHRYPATYKKVRQHINIEIDYEKLPVRNEVRLIGRLNVAQLKADTLDYKWTLLDNVKLKKGNVTGQINIKNTKEVSIDVAIEDMKKKINVRLEAYAQGTKVKIGSVQTFTFDPEEQGKTIETAAEEKSQSKSMSSYMTKQEIVNKELFGPKKKRLQQ